MYIIYTPYVIPSDTRVPNTKIIIYGAVPVQVNNRISHYNIIRKFELTHKGWNTASYKRAVYSTFYHTIEDAATISLNGCSMQFSTFDQAYLAKCTLINRIPAVFLKRIAALTDKMNTYKPVNPLPQYMSDAVPELFL